jgi:hypothetical protein
MTRPLLAQRAPALQDSGGGGSAVLRIILLGAAVVVAVDAVASLLLPPLGGSLLWMFVAEALVYFGAGIAAGRFGGFWAGARCGASVAAVDATIGWAVTWVMGTGRVSQLTPDNVAFVFVTMVVVGAIAGGIGGLLRRLAQRRAVAS